MAQEQDYIDHYILRESIDEDTRFLLTRLKQVSDAFDNLNAKKVNIDASTSTRGTIVAVKEAQKANEDLIKSKEKLLDIDLKAARIATENAKAKLTEAKAAKEAEVGALAEAKAAAILEKAKLQVVSAAQKQADAEARVAAAAAKSSAAQNQTTEFVVNPSRDDSDPKATGQRTNPAQLAETEAQLNATAALSAAQNQAAASSAKLSAEDKALAAAKAKVTAAQSEENITLQGYKIQAAEATKAAKQEALEGLGLIDSYKRLTLQYDAVQRNAKNLSVEFGVNSVQAKAAAKEALALNTQIQAIDKTVGQSQKNVGNYASGFGKAFGAIRQIAYILPGIGLAGIFNLAFEALGKLISGLDLFGSKAGSMKAAQEGIITALKGSESEYTTATNLVATLTHNIEAARQGFLDKDAVLKIYNESIGKTTGQVTSLDQAEQELVKNGDAYIQMTLFKAAAQQASTEAGKQALAAAIQQREDESRITAIKTDDKEGIGDFVKRGEQNLAKASQESKAKAIKTLTDIAEDFRKKADAIAVNFKFDPLAGKGTDTTAIKAQRKKDFEALMKQQVDDEKQLSEVIQLELQSRVRERQLSANDEKGIILRSQQVEIQNEKDKLNAVRATKGVSKNQLINAENDYRTAQTNIASSTKEQLALLELRSARDIIGIRIEAVARQKQIDKDANADTVKSFEEAESKKRAALLKSFESSKQISQDSSSINRDTALTQLEQQHNQGLISEEDYHKARLKIEINYNIQILQAEIEFAKQQLSLKTLSVDERIAAEKRIKEAELGIARENSKQSDEDLAALTKKIDRVKELADAFVNLAKGLASASADKELNRIQDQIDALDKKKAKDIEVANATITNEQDKAAAIAVIEARSQAQKDALERKQREVEQQRARFEKAASIANIILNTAVAVSKFLARGDVPEAITAGIIGAAQLAVAIATPIPKYRLGTKDHPGGAAILGDGGKKEFALMPDGSGFVSADKSTVYDLPKHTQVFPDADQLLEAIWHSAMRKMPGMPVESSSGTKEMTSVLSKKLDRLNNTIKNKNEAHYSANHRGFTALVKMGTNWKQYVDDNINF